MEVKIPSDQRAAATAVPNCVVIRLKIPRRGRLSSHLLWASGRAGTFRVGWLFGLVRPQIEVFFDF